MSSELAMNAYVLLGNTLHYLLNHATDAAEERLGARPEALSNLNQLLEPLSPGTILAGVVALTEPERELLARAVRLCFSSLSPGDFTDLLGLPEDVARQTLAELGLDEPREHVQA